MRVSDERLEEILRGLPDIESFNVEPTRGELASMILEIQLHRSVLRGEAGIGLPPLSEGQPRAAAKSTSPKEGWHGQESSD